MITKQKNVTDILSEKKEYVAPQASLTGVDWPVLMLYASIQAGHEEEAWEDKEDHTGEGIVLDTNTGNDVSNWR